MLVLIATPIGHLSDISFRAVAALKTCDLILCEDTRVSRTLLKAHDIQKPLLSCHAFNERKREAKVLEALRAGQTVALISDAGTPAICDPGARLVQSCHEAGITVSVVPGPCALISALSLSGYIGEQFQFVGYLPKKSGALKRKIEAMLSYPGASVAYETPHHLLPTLDFFSEMAPDSHLFLIKELTKMYETYFQGPASDLARILSQKTIKGEWVVVVLPDRHPKLTQGVKP
ncbi:MAG: 16S rRNA (cytidine(1402)-2'-O)-methyltransferase [Chlamydiota bacterium]